MRDLIQPFRAALRALVADATPIQIAVSGGPDSLALLDLVVRARPPGDPRTTVVHLDHGWRAGSADDAAFVAAEAAGRGLPCVTERLSVLGERSEAAGRAARLALFGRVAALTGASVVLLGHTADDQAETVLLHLLRGSGIAGLTGIHPRTTIHRDDLELTLVRPLLSLRRAEILDYCRARVLTPRVDPSNADPRFTRNRLRHEVMPLLTDIAPGAVEALARLAATARADLEILDRASDDAWPAVARATDRAVEIDRDGFRALAVGVQRGVLRRVGRHLLGPAPDLSLERVEAARVTLLGGRGGTVLEWPGSVRLTLAAGRATFLREPSR